MMTRQEVDSISRKAYHATLADVIACEDCRPQVVALLREHGYKITEPIRLVLTEKPKFGVVVTFKK
jgi:hypothetical protein